jgi:hypothetical protein
MDLAIIKAAIITVLSILGLGGMIVVLLAHHYATAQSVFEFCGSFQYVLFFIS